MDNIIIKYYYVSHRGMVREENQDRVYISSKRQKQTKKIQKGSYRLNDVPFIAAVLDGMGGEQNGADAAELARMTLQNEPIVKDMRSICSDMNKVICAYMNQQHIQSMGTTLAMVRFAANEIEICNVGDSRIYKFASGKIQQISEDHVTMIGGKNGRRVLTQNLGIPEDEFKIEPFFHSMHLEPNTSYLLCSDGLTDAVPETEIERCLLALGAEQAVGELLSLALDNGGKDNISMVLCEIKER